MKAAVLAAKIAVTLALLYYALKEVDFPSAGNDLRSASGPLLLLALAFLALQPLLGAIRWHVIMRHLEVGLPFVDSIRLTYLSTFFNQFVPGGIGGDAVRMWLTVRLGHRPTLAFTGVALDRITMFSTLTLISLALAELLPPFGGRGTLLTSLRLLAFAAVAGLLALVFSGKFLGRLPDARLLRPVRELSRATRGLLGSRRGLPIVTLALLANLNLCVSLFLIALAFHVQLNPALLALAVPSVILASSIPVSVGGWGTREFAMSAILGGLAVSSERAVIASVTFGLASLLISLPGALFLLAGRAPKPAESAKPAPR